MIEPVHSLAGRILVATPAIEDPRFERAVIFVCAHDDNHAMGLTLNRPVDGLTVPDLLTRLGVESDITLPPELVLFGGPVERERGFVLHTNDYVSEGGTMNIGAGVSLTASREILKAMADEARRPRRSILALGYSGWGGGQLESEIEQNAWLVCDPDETLLFGDDYDHKWSHALASLGVPADRLSGQSGSA